MTLHSCEGFFQDYQKGGRDMKGAELIAAERDRQINEEGWSAEHDAEHTGCELAWAATHYVAPGPIKARSLITDEYEADVWPGTWSDVWNKKEKHDRIKQLVIAGALIAAEIDRILKDNAEVNF